MCNGYYNLLKLVNYSSYMNKLCKTDYKCENCGKIGDIIKFENFYKKPFKCMNCGMLYKEEDLKNE